jgi:hypothetical protein
MSTALIVVIVGVVLMLVVLALLVPGARERARVRARERELGQRREEVTGEHRRAADERGQKTELAERRARMSVQEAACERAAAQLEQERAESHEHGLADHELVADDEHGRFAGTSAVETDPGEDLGAAQDLPPRVRGRPRARETR